MELEGLQVYQKSMNIAEKCYDIVVGWAYFDRDTIGRQLVRSADSIAANIAEAMADFPSKKTKCFAFMRGARSTKHSPCCEKLGAEILSTKKIFHH